MHDRAKVTILLALRLASSYAANMSRMKRPQILPEKLPGTPATGDRV